MLVKDIMQHDVACVRPETPLEEIVRLLQRRGVRHLAVLDHEELVGIISDRDLKSVLPGPVAKPAATATGSASGGLTAGDIMTKRVITVEPMVSVEDAARLLVRETDRRAARHGWRHAGRHRHGDGRAPAVRARDGHPRPSSR